MTIAVREYLDARGESPLLYGLLVWTRWPRPRSPRPFTVWSKATFPESKALAAGSMSAKSTSAPVIGSTLARTGEGLIILLGGRLEKRQQAHIGAALSRWQEYKRRKR